LAVASGALALQIVGVRPGLARRTDQVLAGLEAPRTRAHHVYVALEALKVLALTVGGALLLSN
jgi:hypothetical protein